MAAHVPQPVAMQIAAKTNSTDYEECLACQ
jgi:hypothetical protein